MPFIFVGKLFTETNKKKNWNVGDILGRSKDGFQPVNTDEREGMLGDESDSEVIARGPSTEVVGTYLLVPVGTCSICTYLPTIFKKNGEG